MVQPNTQCPCSLTSTEDLNYFLSMYESQPTDKPAHSPQMWDRRADSWERERAQSDKGAQRVRSALEYLEQRGLLHPDYNIADIGCGPGRFATAFAHRVHWVTGFDLSPKMIQYGMEHARREGVNNLTLHACDFQTLDIAREGLVSAFDLVFSSLTPAIHSKAGLQKILEMSRGYCCNITHIFHHNSLRRQLQTELFQMPTRSPWSGQRFYALFNILLLMGYLPEASYDHQSQERKVYPSADYAAIMMEQILPANQQTTANQERILAWMDAHVDEEGLLTEQTHACYGRILWDVRVRSNRLSP